MTDALAGIAQIMERDISRLRTISQNVANSSTPGYRAVSETGIQGQALGPSAATGATQTQVSTQAGALMQTGRSLDVALSGSGFFAVSTPDGVRYTRNGQFHLKPDGTLVTAGGSPVLGVDGSLVLPGDSVSIATDGSITNGSTVIGRLQVMVFADPSQLQPAGDNLYSFTGKTQPATDYQVHQGNLEGSNVEVGAELVNIIGLTRHLEGVQRSVLAYDQMLGSGISEIGKPRS